MGSPFRKERYSKPSGDSTKRIPNAISDAAQRNIYAVIQPPHVYEIRPRKDKRGFDLISGALPFGGLWYLKVSDAIGYAEHCSGSHPAVIRVYDESGKLIEVHKQAGDFKEP